MKRHILLSIGFILVAAIGYSADFTEVKKNLKEDIVRTVDAITVSEIVAVKYAVIQEVNLVRLNVDATQLTYEYDLEAGAQAWCYRLSDEYFDHDRAKSTGEFAGEVILSYEGELSPHRIVNDFMDSLPHKQILLSNFSKIGVGIKRIANTNYVVVRLE